jgi:RNA polymerase sigma-70 factor (sigma-E family)
MARTTQLEGAVLHVSDARRSVTELYHLHYRRLVGLAGMLVDDRGSAEEVVQEAFEALYRHWGQLRDPDAAVTYLNRCVVNKSRSRLRRRRTERAFLAPVPDPVAGADSTALDKQQRQALLVAVADLPQRQREVIVLRYFLDLSEGQIAAWLGISPGSVKRHAFRATTTLQRRMEAWA